MTQSVLAERTFSHLHLCKVSDTKWAFNLLWPKAQSNTGNLF